MDDSPILYDVVFCLSQAQASCLPQVVNDHYILVIE